MHLKTCLYVLYTQLQSQSISLKNGFHEDMFPVWRFYSDRIFIKSRQSTFCKHCGGLYDLSVCVYIFINTFGYIILNFAELSFIRYVQYFSSSIEFIWERNEKQSADSFLFILLFIVAVISFVQFSFLMCFFT